jgi:putative flippase GtrA
LLRGSLLRVLSFGVIGCVGFVVDTLMLYAALSVGSGLIGGRVISYFCAVTVTWALNRRFTFASRAPAPFFQQWAKFVVFQISGAIVNLGVYAVMVNTSAFCAAHPVLGVAAGSIAGMGVNYVTAQRYVFNAGETAVRPQ